MRCSLCFALALVVGCASEAAAPAENAAEVPALVFTDWSETTESSSSCRCCGSDRSRPAPRT